MKGAILLLLKTEALVLFANKDGKGLAQRATWK
jgi:hypothetical protein